MTVNDFEVCKFCLNAEAKMRDEWDSGDHTSLALPRRDAEHNSALSENVQYCNLRKRVLIYVGLNFHTVHELQNFLHSF